MNTGLSHSLFNSVKYGDLILADQLFEVLNVACLRMNKELILNYINIFFPFTLRYSIYTGVIVKRLQLLLKDLLLHLSLFLNWVTIFKYGINILESCMNLLCQLVGLVILHFGYSL